MKVSDLQKVLAELDPNLLVVYPNGETWRDIDVVNVTSIPSIPINFDNPTLTQVAILEERLD